MKIGDTIISDEQAATGYDAQARETNWFGPEVVFGLAFEFVQAGESLLDLGIGSGLSAIPFHKAGLHVYGLDGSNNVLKVCAAKNFTSGLKRHDLRKFPLPYNQSAFNHVISVAVLNSFKDLDELFKEVARIIKAHGIFAFTVEGMIEDEEDRYPINRVDVDQEAKAESAVMLYRHRDEYIKQLLLLNKFEILKSQKFAAFTYTTENRDVFFTAYIARKI